MLDNNLVKILYNPDSEQLFELGDSNTERDNPDNLNATLVSKNKKESYQIKHGVPVMIGSNRTKLKEDIDKYFTDSWVERENGPKFWHDDGFSYRLCLLDALEHLGSLRGAKVLILGAGRGHEVGPFIERGASVVLTDLSLKGLLMNNSPATKVAMDAEKLFFLSESFDFVYGQSMLMFVDKDAVYKEVHRVLKKGGIYLSVEPMENSYLLKIYRKLFARFSKYDHIKNNHPKYLRIEEIENMVKRFGKSQLYQNFMIISPIHNILKLFRLNGIVKIYLYLERTLIKILPSFKRHAYLGINVFQK